MAHEEIGEKRGAGRRENGVRSILAPSLSLLFSLRPLFRAASRLTKRLEEAIIYVNLSSTGSEVVLNRLQLHDCRRRRLM